MTVRKPPLAALLSILALLLASVAAHADVLVPNPPSIAASGYILIDAETGTVLAEDNADASLPPASLTKIMTSYVAAGELEAGRIQPTDMVPVSVRAWSMEGSRMFIREGTKVAVEDLLKGIVIQSGNDASVALAEYIAGTEDAFADMMNRTAEAIGMQASHFVNATGLPAEEHYTTARDLSLLAQRLIADHPDHYRLYSQKEFEYNNIRQRNRNRLLWRDRYVDGIKTGHTSVAGYCLVASAVRNDMRLISVVLGTRSDDARMRETQKLLAYGFRYFQTQRLFGDDETLHTAKVWMAPVDSVRVGLKRGVTLTFPRGHLDDIEREMDIDATLKAPLAYGDEVGELRIMLDGKVLERRPLVVLEDVPPAGFFVRLWHTIYLFFMDLLA